MKSKMVKSVFAGLSGALLSAISLYGMNPIGMSAYGALTGSSLWSIPVIPVFLIVAYYRYGLLPACKYAAVMFICTTFLIMMKNVGTQTRRVNVYLTALATTTAYGLMECADAFMERQRVSYYGMIVLSMVLVFSLTIVFGRLLEILFGEDHYRMSGRVRRKAQQRSRNEKLVGTYEEKLRMMAQCFEKISRSINCFPETQVCDANLSAEAMVINDIWKYRLGQSRKAVALQLKELSDILRECTSDSYLFSGIGYEKEHLLAKRLKEHGVIMKNVVLFNNKRGIDEVNIVIKAWKKRVALKTVAGIISEVIGKTMEFRKNSYSIVGKDYQMYVFVEEPNFFILHGAAKRCKAEDGISGDNFTCLELNNGQALLSVSDGMGHGLRASRESETALELLEEMMEGGFSEETAVKLINSVFLIDSDIANPTALDMGIIDMYSGICEFMKLGAASTFVKRGNWVEVIKSTSLPLGSSGTADIETASKKLYDGDFVIMMSDGMIESIREEEREQIITEIILQMKEGKPKDMADEILNRTLDYVDEEREDDMMVLVTGIWNKCTV